mgnify:CR=1 FL=1
MKNKIKTIIFVVLGIMLSYYMSNIFTQILCPKLQLFVDTSKYYEDNSIQIFEYDKQFENAISVDGMNYNYETTFGKKSVKLKFQYLNDNIINCYINDQKMIMLKAFQNIQLLKGIQIYFV